MEIVNIHDAKTHLSALIRRVLKGEKIIIARHGEPVAELAPIQKRRKQRKPGLLKGELIVYGDFKDSDEEIEEMFYKSQIFPDEPVSD